MKSIDKMNNYDFNDRRPDNIIISWRELKLIIPMSDSTARRWERNGKFPKRLKYGANRVGWMRTEVNEWIRLQADAREPNPKHI